MAAWQHDDHFFQSSPSQTIPLKVSEISAPIKLFLEHDLSIFWQKVMLSGKKSILNRGKNIFFREKTELRFFSEVSNDIQRQP